ncbi:hypothetical protein F8M41_007149 [Gigaspora margarita]|uniref:Uncharacterized protein n=1 Tax=Gigaspora margarita TaxID=4874 RepID=A0A8H4AWE4_GIGMA|nr:hypothetical protein F8M41_007149 [Gigaspora margarita]
MIIFSIFTTPTISAPVEKESVTNALITPFKKRYIFGVPLFFDLGFGGLGSLGFGTFGTGFDTRFGFGTGFNTRFGFGTGFNEFGNSITTGGAFLKRDGRDGIDDKPKRDESNKQKQHGNNNNKQKRDENKVGLVKRIFPANAISFIPYATIGGLGGLGVQLN